MVVFAFFKMYMTELGGVNKCKNVVGDVVE